MPDTSSPSANRAVFLSYASQDVEAARKICDSLRSGGVDVWFDADGGLEHGDEWDAKIRRQIKESVLFIPVISASTQAREEGYFRLEWDLAAERARTIASGVPFILPIVIDDTREPDALVPDRFRSVQWTRARGGEVTPEVRQRLLKLWSHRTGVLRSQSSAPSPNAEGDGARQPSSPTRSGRSRATWGLAGVLVIAACLWIAYRPKASPREPAAPSPVPASANRTAEQPPSEARRIALRAQALVDSIDSVREDYQLADELIAQAREKDPTDAEVCAIKAQIDERFIQRGWDPSDARREAASVAVQRAIRLDPSSFEARFAQAFLLGLTGREGEERERQLRELLKERPTDKRVLRALATTLDRLGRIDESAEVSHRSAGLPGGDPLALYSLSQAYWFAGRANEAEEALEASIAQRPFASSLLMKVWYDATLRGDIDSARRTIEKLDPASMHEDRGAIFAFITEMFGRNPDKAIEWLTAVPRDWINDNWYNGPKGLLLGDAHQMAGRTDAARIEWQGALKLVNQRLEQRPKDVGLLHNKVHLLAHLGQRDEAEQPFSLALQLAGARLDQADPIEPALIHCCIALGKKAEAVRQIRLFIEKDRRWSVAYSSARLRLDPGYDTLRGDPEFERIIAEVEEREKAIASRKGSEAGSELAADLKKSIAVLPFENLSEDKSSEYFSDGISEELLNVLAKVPGLKVTARTSSFFFKGKNLPIQDIARQLGVAYVVEGSVQRAGDSVRISAQLIKASDGFHVWSEHFDRELKNVFALQDEIAGLIAGQLSLRVGASSPASSPSINPQALEYYLQANQLMRLRDTLFTNGEQVEDLLNRALALEPGFARAHAMLAVVWAARASLQTNRLSRFSQRNSQDRVRIEAKARKAIELDPTAPEPHSALSVGMWTWWDLEGARAELRTALSLNPNYLPAHLQLARIDMDDGQMDDALAQARLAVQLDPLSQESLEALGRVLHVSGRYTEAIAAYDRALALADSLIARQHKAYALAQLGRKDDAIALARTIPWPSYRFRALAAAGAKSEAEALLPKTEPENRVYYLLILGRKEEALAALDPGEMLSTYVHDLLFEPWYDPVRTDPRFQEFLETLGITEAHARAQAWRKAHPAETSIAN